MAFGYHGKILHVDLTKGDISTENPDESFYRQYMGGSALGLYYLLTHTAPGVDPLSPENVLVLALSVITGAPISGQSRMTAVAKSPLTGCVGDAQSGGFFPAELKFSGFDAIVIKGRSENPVYLWIHNGEVEIRPAGHLWGSTTGQTEEKIREELDDKKIQIAQCGPAGERLVRFAAIINMSNRANGRTGMGAVMGSKNLKAVAVRGNNRPPLADRRGLIDLARLGADSLEESDCHGLSLFGTAEIVNFQNKEGGLVTRNWQSGYFETAGALDGTTMSKTILKERDTCYACSVRCKRVVEVKNSHHPVKSLYGGPEYETISTFGSYCGIDDLEAVAYANQLCNMYGMDTISCGATIAWAMDCFEQGILTLEDTGGIDLRYGNPEAMMKITEMIARREGFGDILAEGSARAAEQIGRGSEDLVVTAKKQELPAHMPQVKRSLALIYAVNPFGADHQSSEHDPSWEDYPERMDQISLPNPQAPRLLNKEKVNFALRTQHLYSCLDSINVCQFVFGPSFQLYDSQQLVEAVCMITGWDVTLNELLLLGERRLNLLRAFNGREGIGREADTLPQKLFKPLVGGPTDGLSIDAQEMNQALDWYYSMAGWDTTSGLPTRQTLEQINLEWVADILNQ
ncbi:MAG: aldehyde ferredoxin oxidoreductase family protein [Anaerolineales bacterium]|nr:aldehyde ferredoxin oxidoreductase family protein [Anaerolineales bacterium]